MKDDSYGSTVREAMKKSMEEPFRATNRRELKPMVGPPFVMLLLWFAGALLLVAVALGVESWLR